MRASIRAKAEFLFSSLSILPFFCVSVRMKLKNAKIALANNHLEILVIEKRCGHEVDQATIQEKTKQLIRNLILESDDYVLTLDGFLEIGIPGYESLVYLQVI
ncbi:hypothetical protein NQZ79_g8442 [Umbelopsis isabellina]|nr:hypothetical protein NQZ79_g8442 [Umbelopsis isabellina]